LRVYFCSPDLLVVGLDLQMDVGDEQANEQAED